LDELKQFGNEFEEDFFPAITLEATLDCHNVIGGTARHQVREALKTTESRVQKLIDTYGTLSLNEPAAAEETHAGA
jgi:argininosuccinate lyase